MILYIRFIDSLMKLVIYIFRGWIFFLRVDDDARGPSGFGSPYIGWVMGGISHIKCKCQEY